MEDSIDLPRLSTTTVPLVGSIYARTRSYLAFIWLGLGTLLPFNFFITAGSYFCKKLRDPKLLNSSVPLELLYENSVTSCASFTNLLTMILITFIFVPYIYKYRIYTSLIVIIICFIFSLTLALVNTKHWRGLFFALTMILVMIQSVCSAVLLNSYFSLASTLPSQYVQGFHFGQSLGGVFIIICSIISTSVSANISTSTAIYFLLAIIVILSNIIVYYFLERTHLFQIYSSAVQEINNDHEPLFHESSSDQNESHTVSVASIPVRGRLFLAYKHVKWHFLSVFITFVATYSVFPAYLSKIKSAHPLPDDTNPLWPNRLFLPVTTFLLFFLGDTIGRMISSKLHKPSIHSSRILFSICLSRFLFIFLFGFCNLPKREGYPTIFHHDIIYAFLVLIFALSHGYCTSLNMIYAPRRVNTNLSGTVGALMMMALALGTFVGSMLSYAVVALYDAYAISDIQSCPK